MLGPSETCRLNNSLNSSEEPSWKYNRVKLIIDKWEKLKCQFFFTKSLTIFVFKAGNAHHAIQVLILIVHFSVDVVSQLRDTETRRWSSYL